MNTKVISAIFSSASTSFLLLGLTSSAIAILLGTSGQTVPLLLPLLSVVCILADFSISYVNKVRQSVEAGKAEALTNSLNEVSMVE